MYRAVQVPADQVRREGGREGGREGFRTILHMNNLSLPPSLPSPQEQHVPIHFSVQVPKHGCMQDLKEAALAFLTSEGVTSTLQVGREGGGEGNQ